MNDTDSTVVYKVSETTHWKKLFPEKTELLGSHNLNAGEELIAEIKHVEIGTIKDKSGKDARVPVLTFTSVPPMVLNITNTRVLASLYGEDYSAWIGEFIQLYVVKITAFGTEQTALRIRETKPASQPDIAKYMQQINSAKTLDELKRIFITIPKHIKTHLTDAKDNMKKQLSEVANAQD